MEGTGDSHNELLYRGQAFLGSLSQSITTSSPSSNSVTAAATVSPVSREDASTPFVNQLQQPSFKSHPINQPLSQNQGQYSSCSSLFQQYPRGRDSSYQQSCSLQSNPHSRSLSQPSSFFQGLWQSPSFQHGPSAPYQEGIVKTKDEAICSAASPSSELSHKAASPSDFSMSDQEMSPAPSISGHSIPPLPPLSPSPNTYQSASKKHSGDSNQVPLGQMMRKGHRRSHSEVSLGFSAGKDCLFSSRPVPFGQNEACVDDVPLLKLNRSNTTSRKEPHRMVMDVVGEREGEGMDDLFSMYMNVDKVESRHNFGVIQGQDRADNSKVLKKRGIPGVPLLAEYVKTQSPSFEKPHSLQQVSDSDKEDSDKEEDSYMEDSYERVAEDGRQKGGSFKGGTSNSRHQRSASMDSLPPSMIVGDDAQHSSGACYKKQVRHHHSLSIDGSLNTSLNFLNGEVDGTEMKKILADDKLAEIALMDPKRAKRILANRQSAARSKERKVRYISELERKVQTLQTEATTLSAQLTLMQRDSTGLTNENKELKLRLQSMEQQAQLREALHEALRDEVQRLKIATGQIPGALNQQFFQMMQQSTQRASQQTDRQHPQPPLQQQSQASSSSLHQSTEMQK